MAQPYIGEIRLFGGNFAPRGWSFCDGQLLAISQNDALFSILGTTYGGDGRTTFGLPDLRGRTAIGQGQGPGLSNRPLGQKSGTYINTITVNNMPSHNHSANINAEARIPVSSVVASETDPDGTYLTTTTSDFYNTGGSTQSYGPTGTTFSGTLTVLNNGGQQAINNQQPYLGIRYIIALVGLYPSRH